MNFLGEPTGATGGPFNFQELPCLFSLALHDVDRDNLLDKTEYTNYVNFLAGTEVTRYLDLPDLVRANFAYFSVPNSVDINGAHFLPAANIRKDSTHLMTFCDQTYSMIQKHMEHSLHRPEISSVSEDTLECLYSLALADEDRNSLLSEEEFPRFVFMYTTYHHGGFDDMDVMLQSTYHVFATSVEDLQIDIEGAYFPFVNTTEPERRQMEMVCKETKEMVFDLNGLTAEPTITPVASTLPPAVVSSSAPTMATLSPTAAATPEATTLVPSPLPRLRIESDFGIANSAGLQAVNILSTQLKAAYMMTAQQVLIMNQDQTVAATFVADSGSLDFITDVSCPAYVKDANVLCQSVVGSFLVELSSPVESVSQFQKEYEAEMNKKIENGSLQNNLNYISPQTRLTILTGSGGEAAIIGSGGSSQNDSDNTLQAGAITALVVASMAVVIALFLFVRIYRQSKGRVQSNHPGQDKPPHRGEDDDVSHFEDEPTRDFHDSPTSARGSNVSPSDHIYEEELAISRTAVLI